MVLAIAMEPAGRDGRSHTVWVVEMNCDCLHHKMGYSRHMIVYLETVR